MALRCKYCGEPYDLRTGHLIRSMAPAEVEKLRVIGFCYPCWLDPNRNGCGELMHETALKLLDAILEAYDAYHEARDGNTFCNLAVDRVLARMGYEKMRNPGGHPMMANQMVDFMTRSPDWEEIKMEWAQTMANDGRVVVAGRQDEPHGHVVVVRPGVPEYSEKYKTRVPRVSHVGKNSFIGRTAAWAFGGSEPPTFWVLREGL